MAAENRKTQKMGRLAMRQEGNMWNAYYALPDTMNDALLIGSIAMAAVEESEERREQFLNLMGDFVADMLEKQVGFRPEMSDPEPAPLHERGGNA